MSNAEWDPLLTNDTLPENGSVEVALLPEEAIKRARRGALKVLSELMGIQDPAAVQVHDCEDDNPLITVADTLIRLQIN
jgi:hypothetical protein